MYNVKHKTSVTLKCGCSICSHCPWLLAWSLLLWNISLGLMYPNMCSSPLHTPGSAPSPSSSLSLQIFGRYFYFYTNFSMHTHIFQFSVVFIVLHILHETRNRVKHSRENGFLVEYSLFSKFAFLRGVINEEIEWN